MLEKTGKVLQPKEEIILLNIFHSLINYLEDYDSFDGCTGDLSWRTFSKSKHYENHKGTIDGALEHLGATMEECRFLVYFMSNGLQEILEGLLPSSEPPTEQKYRDHYFGIGVEFDTLFLPRFQGLQLVNIRPRRSLDERSKPDQNSLSLPCAEAAWLLLGKGDFID
jgi:hypothetical protein